MRPLSLPYGEDGLTLQSVMQLAGWVGSGGSAKHAIQAGEVLVNGAPETRRSHRLSLGDRVAYQGDEIVLVEKDAH